MRVFISNGFVHHKPMSSYKQEILKNVIFITSLYQLVVLSDSDTLRHILPFEIAVLL